MIPTWGTSTGRSQASLVPSLLLDFSYQTYLLNGSAFAAFGGSPGITFSRGTNATLIDSTGQLTYAPSNMFLNSESFAATSWTKSLSTITSNAIAAPDGTLTADKLVTDSTAASAHSVGVNVTAQSGVNYGYSLYVKAAELTQIALTLPATPFGTVQVTFDTATNPASVVATTGSPLWSSIVAVGDGWYRVAMGVLATSSGSGFTQVRLAKDGSVSFNGNGTDGIYIWGAQIGAVTYETAPRAYNSTTPKNLLGRTEEFDNAAWAKSNATITANAIADPNGYLNADKLIEDTATSEHFVDQPFTAISATTYTYSAYLKAGERSQAVLRFAVGSVFVGGSVQVGFTLTGSGSSFPISGSPTAQSITAVGNGWYRCSISVLTVPAVAATPTARVQLYDGTSSTYTGNGTSGAYLWGAQLSDSASLDPYVYNPAAAPTSTAYYGPRFEYSTDIAYGANLIPYAYPQDFNSANWTKARATAPATIATADPTGTYTAYKLTEDTSVNLSHLIQWQGVSTAVTVGTQYTVSGYAKAAERTTIAVSFGTDNGAFTTNGGRIDITPSSSGGTGAVSAVSGAAPIVTDAGNGWWRFSVTATATATAQFAFRVTLVSGGTTNYTGDGTSGVYIWGAQLTESAAAVPFFYYPYTPLGLLIEEARTNLIFPSDANTGWTASPGSSVVATANAAISPDGTTNATKLATNDTATSGHLWFKTYTGAINTTYCGSVYLKAEEYTRAEVSFGNTGFASTTTGALFDLAAGTVVITGGGSTATITPVGNGWYRCSVTATSDADGGAYVFTISPKPDSVTTIGASYTSASTGLGVYVYGVQVEAGGFATSFVPTVSASATRSADVATMVGNNFTNWYNQTTGTLAVTFDASANNDATYVSASNGTITQNSTHIDNDTGTGNMRAVYYSGSALVAALELSAVGTVGATNRIATAYAVNDFAASRNGGAIVTDTLGAVPVGLTQLNIGTDDRLVAVNYTSNHIKTISYFNSRLPDSSLQAITA